MQTRTLTSLRPGDRAMVECLAGEAALSRRLEDMGLIPGTRVACRMRTPSGALGAYEVRGTVIALRRQDADGITVEPEA